MKNKILYHNIVFFQGEEADEPLQILDEKGVNKCLDFLAQWDYGSEMEHSPEEIPPWGTSDYVIKKKEYIICYNLRLGYIGLVRLQVVKPPKVGRGTGLKVVWNSKIKEFETKDIHEEN